jgi:hypothetical protein
LEVRVLARDGGQAFVFIFRHHAADGGCGDLASACGFLENGVDELVAGRDVLVLELRPLRCVD